METMEKLFKETKKIEFIGEILQVSEIECDNNDKEITFSVLTKSEGKNCLEELVIETDSEFYRFNEENLKNIPFDDLDSLLNRKFKFTAFDDHDFSANYLISLEEIK